MSVALVAPQGVGELVQRAPDELRLLPQVGGQEAVRIGHGSKGSLESVLEGLGRAGRGCVGIVDTGKLEETLDSGGGDEGGTAGSGDKLRVPLAAAIKRIEDLDNNLHER